MDSLLQDVRFAIRMLVKSPVLTLTAAIVLAFGIGANLVNFAMADAYLLRKPNFSEPDQLLHVWETNRRDGSTRLRASLPNFLDWKTHNQVFSDMAVFNYTGETLITSEGPERVSASRVSANTFELLGVKPLLGRTFQHGEDASGAADVVVLSHRFWKSRYAADPGVLGRLLNVNGRQYTIIGVMPADFAFPLTITQFWIPRELNPAQNPREQRFLQVAARLKPGVTLQQAGAEMGTIAARLASEYPQSNKDSGVSVQPLPAALNFAYDVLSMVTAILGVAALLLLLVVATNVASLLMSRAIGRSREIAIRAALGAGRTRIIRQLLTESLLLALAGGALGVLLAGWTLRGIAQAMPEDLYRVGELSIESPALILCAGLCLFTAVAFGLAPAMQLSRTNVVETLKGSGPGGKWRLFGGLTIVQVSLSAILLISAGVITQSLLQLKEANLGFNARQTLTMNLSLPRSEYKSAEQRAAFHRRWVEEVQSVPGVQAAATVSFLPLNHETDTVEIELKGRPEESSSKQRIASQLSVTPDFFQAMQIPLKAGRAFTEQDSAATTQAVIINEALAQRYFGNSDAIGAQLLLKDSDKSTAAVIVGVAGNIRYSDELEGVYPLQIYRPQGQQPASYFYLVARYTTSPDAVAPGIRGALGGIDGRLPVTQVRTMEQVVAESLLPRSAMAVSLAIFGLGALLMAALSLYGLLSHWVMQRTREIGIRMALGARPGDVLRLVVKQGVTMVGIGASIGLLASVAVTRVLRSFLLATAGLNSVLVIGVGALLLGIALLACYIPARRAARVDPMVALRYE